MLDVLNLFFGNARDLPGHLGFVLLAAGFFVTSVVWLRLLLVIGFASLVVYYALAPVPLYAGIVWNAVFIAINLYRLVALMRARRLVGENSGTRLLRASLATLDDEELARIAQAGEVVSFDPGAALVTAGEPIPALYLILEGRAEVTVGGRPVGRLGRGAFIGDMALLTGTASTATVRAATPLDAIALDPEMLTSEESSDPRLAAGVYRALGASLAGKLTAASASRRA